jgi:hypothetical protein
MTSPETGWALAILLHGAPEMPNLFGLDAVASNANAII